MNSKLSRSLNLNIVFIFLFVFFFTLTISCHSQSDKQPISVNGDIVEYLTKEKKISASGNVVVIYQDSKLTCDKIEVSTETKEGFASGNVVVTLKDTVMRGDKINYNFNTKVGKIINASIDAPPMYAHGDVIDRDAEKATITNGCVTSCDLDHPHYRIIANKIEFYPDEKIVAKDVKVFAGGLPLFYFPRYVHYLKTDKTIHFNIMPGNSKDWGTFILSKTRFNLSENVRARVYLDWRERRGFGEGFGVNYDYGPIGVGDFKAYYTYEHIPQVGAGTSKLQRYLLRFRHKTQLENTDIISEFHRTSDKQMLKDYFFREYESDAQPKSYIYVSHNVLPISSNLSALFLKRTNSFYDQLEKLPQVKFETNNQPIFNSPVYFKNITTISNFTQKYQSPTDVHFNQVRFDILNKLSLPFRVGFVEFTPYGGSRETAYKYDINKDDISPRTAVIAGIDVSAKVFKVYNFKTNALGLDINKLRHIITPVAKFNYTHRPTIRTTQLREFDDIDKVEYDKRIGIELVNTLQTKTSEDISRDLAIFRIDSSYILKDYYFGKNKFTDLYFDLEVWPYSWMYFQTEAKYNRDLNAFQTVNVDLGINQKRWNYLIGHRYYRSVGKQMISLLRYRFNPLWECKMYHRYEFANNGNGLQNSNRNGLREQEYSISRDLHCWILNLAYNIKQNGGHTIWFTLTCKAFPEAELKMDASYNAPRTEAGRF